jgi:AcrR family transcriptional regulator
VTVNPREALPAARGRQTQAAIDAAARAVLARKGFLATTVSDIAGEADRSAGSLYNCHDSEESMVRAVQRDGQCRGGPKLIASALVSMLHQICLAEVFHRTIYHKETGPT